MTRMICVAMMVTAMNGVPCLAQSPSVSDTLYFNSLPYKLSDPHVQKETVSDSVLTLKEACSLALAQHPEIHARSSELDAKRADMAQAGTFPNPGFETELENVAGSGPFAGFTSRELTLAIAQPIPLGGNRSTRKERVRLQYQQTGQQLKQARIDLTTRVVKRFVDVLIAQERVEIQQQLKIVMEVFLESVVTRVRAGKDPKAEISRAQTAQIQSNLELDRARFQLESARRLLTSTWGKSVADFSRVQGSLELLTSLPSLDSLSQRLDTSPVLVQTGIAIQESQTRIESEKARRIPDLVLRGGLRQSREPDDHAFLVSLSVPLPLYDRRSDAIEAARYRYEQQRYKYQAVRLRNETLLEEYYATLCYSRNRANSIEHEVMPQVRQTVREIRNGYSKGRYAVLDVLDAQQRLYETRLTYFETLKSYHYVLADLDRLLGTMFSDSSLQAGPAKR